MKYGTNTKWLRFGYEYTACSVGTLKAKYYNEACPKKKNIQYSDKESIHFYAKQSH